MHACVCAYVSTCTFMVPPLGNLPFYICMIDRRVPLGFGGVEFKTEGLNAILES